MNTSMFLPQVAEKDLYTSKGQQVDDINSVVEYVDQVVLGNPDTTPEDEDDDSGQNFHTMTHVVYCYEPFFTIRHDKELKEIRQHAFADLTVQTPAPVSFDVIAPPPEC